MDGLICKYCGGNSFTKVAGGYECDYCHAFYPYAEVGELKSETPAAKRLPKKWLGLFILFVLVAGASIWRFSVTTKDSVADYPNGEKVAKAAKTPKPKYKAEDLNNPERNVTVAELSLVQDDLDLAKESVKQFGGSQSKALAKRVVAAQKEHDAMVANRLTTAPKADMLIENPKSPFAVTTYYQESGFMVAYTPDFDQYSTADILQIWGQPDQIVTDMDQIRASLTIGYDKNDQPESYETKVLWDQWENRQLTYREIRAFEAFIYDSNQGGNFTKEFIYQNQGKPNVYFKADQVKYVSPVMRYVAFSRLPEKHPYVGLGKYPDKFPKHYGAKGLLQ